MEEDYFLIEETWEEEKRALELRSAFLRGRRKYKDVYDIISSKSSPPVKATLPGWETYRTMLTTATLGCQYRKAPACIFCDQDNTVLPCRAVSP